jgi:hypothetical protein
VNTEVLRVPEAHLLTEIAPSWIKRHLRTQFPLGRCPRKIAGYECAPVLKKEDPRINEEIAENFKETRPTLAI